MQVELIVMQLFASTRNRRSTSPRRAADGRRMKARIRQQASAASQEEAQISGERSGGWLATSEFPKPRSKAPAVERFFLASRGSCLDQNRPWLGPVDLSMIPLSGHFHTNNKFFTSKARQSIS